MVCQYCKKRLGIIQRLKGQSFCSAEHQELYFGLSFERLRESVTEYSPNKAKPQRPEPNLELAQAEPMVELQARKDTPELSPTIEICNLVEAIGTSRSDLPEASFLPELPSRQDRLTSTLNNYSAEPVPVAVQFAGSPTGERSLRVAPALVQHSLPAQPQVEVRPLAGQPTWRPVLQGYPPVLVCDSATLLLDPSEAKPTPLSTGEPCRGEGPAPVPQTVAIETTLRHPKLPFRQTPVSPNTEVAERDTHPPEAPACESSWVPRLGSGYAAPSLTGVLYPQVDALRLAPLAIHKSLGSLSSFSFFTSASNIPVFLGEIQVALFAHLPAAIIPHQLLSSQKPQATARPLALRIPTGQFVVESATPLRCEPSRGQISSTWLETTVAGQLPQIPAVPLPALSGLNPTTDAIALQCSTATNTPPAIETAVAITGAVPLLRLSRPLSVAAPAMPLASSTRPPWHEGYVPGAPIGEQRDALNLVYLQPSLPSPSSLVTWSQSLSISTPAVQPSDLNRPAPIALSARQGHVDALPPSSPSRRGQRLTPLKPQANGVVWTPVAPTEAALQPQDNQPICPGSEGIATPGLAPVRAQPASMPVRPLASSPSGIEPGAGPQASGPSLEMKLTCIEMAHGIWKSACGPRSESGTALPSLPTERYSFSIAMAPGSHMIEWGPIPGGQPDSAVQPFSAVNRSALSTTASLAGTIALQSAVTKVHLDSVLRKLRQL